MSWFHTGPYVVLSVLREQAAGSCDLLSGERLFSGPALCFLCFSPDSCPLSITLGTGLPKRYPPALQHFPRPLREGVERSRKLLCGDPVSELRQIACDCGFPL